MRDRLLEELGQEIGLRYDETGSALYGVYGGYHVAIGAGVAGGSGTDQQILFAVSLDGAAPDRDALRTLVMDSKVLRSVGGTGFTLAVNVKKSALSRRKTMDNYRTALEETAAFLRRGGYADCCQHCGQSTPTSTYLINGSYAHLCADCYQTVSAGAAAQQDRERQKKENVVGGLVGALLGSLVGVLVMVLFDQLGYVAALSGLVMAVCTLRGYELLGGKLGKLGTALCVAIMIFMVYIGNQVTWALAFYNELKDYMDVTFSDCFRSLTDLLDVFGDEVWGSYYSNLVQQYLFMALGAVPTIITSRRNQKIRHAVRPVGGPEI